MIKVIANQKGKCVSVIHIRPVADLEGGKTLLDPPPPTHTHTRGIKLFQIQGLTFEKSGTLLKSNPLGEFESPSRIRH